MNRKIPALKLITSILVGLAASGLAWANDAQNPNPRFLTQGDAVYDKKSHLTWALCSVGQHWKEGAGCDGAAKTFTFDNAQKLRGGGWRVSTGDELATLFDRAHHATKQNPAIGDEEFPDANLAKLAYWTRMPSTVGPDWGVDFIGGNIAQSKRYIAHAVRLVRGKQKL